MWAARDLSGGVCIYLVEPELNKTEKCFISKTENWHPVPSSFFPELKPGEKTRLILGSELESISGDGYPAIILGIEYVKGRLL